MSDRVNETKKTREQKMFRVEQIEQMPIAKECTAFSVLHKAITVSDDDRIVTEGSRVKLQFATPIK